MSLKRYAGASIVPIFSTDERTGKAVEFFGTGFVVSDGVFVTCWHCVRDELAPGQVYRAYFQDEHGKYWGERLDQIAQDENGTDLASARINVASSMGWQLYSGRGIRLKVSAFGYPYTTKRSIDGHDLAFELQARYLRGYVTRDFYYDQAGFGRTRSYEIDMPAPAGLSGAPLYTIQGNLLAGVVYGVSEVSMIEEFSYVDPDTGERTPELQRFTSFALAHHVDSLSNLKGPATKGHPLNEILACT